MPECKFHLEIIEVIFKYLENLIFLYPKCSVYDIIVLYTEQISVY